VGMEARVGKLTAIQVKNLVKVPGRHSDGDGLMLDVGKSGSASWVVRVQHTGKRRDIGLGSLADVSLAQARTAADAVRKQVKAGLDPTAKAEEAPQVPTFREAAVQVHAEHMPTWKNAKYGTQWLAELERHVFPDIGDVRVDEIDGPMVRDTLVKIWLTVPDTAKKVRQRVGTVLDWAHAKGFRPHELTMRSITKGLPKQPKRQEHFAALPWQEVPGFLFKLRETNKAGLTVKLLFKFVVLTAVRSGEARGARWSEINLDTKVWTIPAARMKAGKVHVVPLSAAALTVLEKAAELRASSAADALIFPGERKGKAMSDMALTMLLRRMGVEATAHGFRSSFRDWCAEATNYPREVAEAALAHALESKVEAAYRRSDLLEKRRKLMDEWGAFCTTGAAAETV